MPRSPGYAEARARSIKARFFYSDAPRIKVRIDPIVRRSLRTLAAGLVLILASIILAPPA